MGDLQHAEAMIDFDRIPLQQAVTSLRSLGEIMLRGLMANSPRLTWPSDLEKDVPTLEKLVQPWPNPLSRRLKPKRFLGRRMSRYFAKRSLRRIMRGRMKWASYRDEFATEVQGQLHEASRLGLPPEMWRLAGEAAWLDTHFQHDINRVLDARLRGEVLLAGGRPERVTISPRAIWAVIALAATQPRTRRENRALSRISRQWCEAFAKVAHQQALGESWAGFWDQWLLSRALPLFKRRFPGRESGLLQALITMPLRMKLGSKAFPPPPLPPRLWPLKWWWYLRLGLRTMADQWRAVLDGKPENVPDIADPEWHRHQPRWMDRYEPMTRNLNGGPV